jgi:hypothetical protein
MHEPLILPDLDIMNAATLKAMVRAQHAQHEQYIATLDSRASEIAHLKLLLDKLQRMLFGARSEKLVHQVAQLELQLEELETLRGEEEVSLPLPFHELAGREPRTFQPFAVRTSAARDRDASSRDELLPRLWIHAARVRRRCLRSARVCA